MTRNSRINTFSYVETWSIFSFKPATGYKKQHKHDQCLGRNRECISILEAHISFSRIMKRSEIYMPTSSFWSTCPWTSCMTFLISDASFSIESNNCKWEVIFCCRKEIFLSLASTEHFISQNDSYKHTTTSQIEVKQFHSCKLFTHHGDDSLIYFYCPDLVWVF